MPSSPKTTLVGIFVLILMIIAAIAWYFDHERKRYSNLGIARHYFQHYDSPRIDSLAVGDSLGTEGWLFYDQRAYDTAIVLLQNKGASDPDYGLARLCIGVAQLAKGDTQQGIATLDGIYLVAEKQEILSWYLVLGYLAGNEEDLARYHLEELATDSTIDHSQADQILEELESIWRM